MKDEREVFDELIEKDEYSLLENSSEDIWEMFEEAYNDKFIGSYISQYFSDVLMEALDDKELLEMMNEIFEKNCDSIHLFKEVVEYCNWIIDKRGKKLTAYDLESLMLCIRENANNLKEKEIFDDNTIKYGEYNPCDITIIDRCDIEGILMDYFGQDLDGTMEIVLEYYNDDDIMRLWYDYYDAIINLYDEWKNKLGEEEEDK